MARRGVGSGYSCRALKKMKLNPKATILLVEDEPSDVFLMKRALKGAQIPNPLQVARDGQEAINYLSGVGPYSDRSQFPIPSIIFLDLKLPYKTGFEILTWIRTQPHLDKTLVMVLTSSSEEKDIAQCYKLGARTFLVKPPNAGMRLELMVSLKEYWIKHNEFTLPDDGDLES
jgi:CheY-like chemotaxis protein